MMTELTCSGASLASASAAVVDFTASSVAEMSLNFPPNPPKAVLRAATMYTGRANAMFVTLFVYLRHYKVGRNYLSSPIS